MYYGADNRLRRIEPITGSEQLLSCIMEPIAGSCTQLYSLFNLIVKFHKYKALVISTIQLFTQGLQVQGGIYLTLTI